MAQLTGGCLCGAVRYEIDDTPKDASYCHCSMCRRATGSPVAAFANVRRDRVRFTKGAPAIYRSSAFAERGFCPACGSPLTFAYDAFPTRLAVSIGSLDAPESVKPSLHWGIEAKLPWFEIADALPRRRTEDAPELAAIREGRKR